MDKNELKSILENGMTVEEVIKKLQKFDKNLIVINRKDKQHLPIDSIELTKVDYCYDEIISKEVVAIW